MKKLINLVVILFVIISSSGCLTPYDNEFKCQPGIIGKCTSSIVDTYNETIKEIDNKGK
jgi:hypothetical protein